MKKFTEILKESSDTAVIKDLSKGIKDDEYFPFDDVARSIRRYAVDSGAMVYLQKNNKNLMDELWYRLLSSYEESENYTSAFIKKIKKNFYSLEKKYFKNLIYAKELKGYGTKDMLAKFKK